MLVSSSLVTVSQSPNNRIRSRVRHVIQITVGKNEYVKDLKARMLAAKISQNMLADAMGLTPSQVSRWFTPNKARSVTPSMETVAKIEEALVNIQKKREREGKKKS